MKTHYHLVIFSRLQSYDGGRETWLDLFIPELHRQESSSKINLYFYRDKATDPQTLIPVIEFGSCSAERANLPFGSAKLVSIMRLTIFTIWVSLRIRSKVIRFENSDHIIVGVGSFHELIAMHISRLVNRSKQVKTVSWLRTVLERQISYWQSRRMKRLIVANEYRLLRSVDLIIANGWDTGRFYDNRRLANSVIPNALDLTEFSARPTAKTDKAVISYVGRLRREKGILSFIKAIKVFNEKFPNHRDGVSFEVVGGGENRLQCERFDAVNFRYLGPLSNREVKRYLRNVTAGVNLSFELEEFATSGVSNGLLEQMASSVVPICWENSIYRQVLDDRSAIFVPENSVHGLSEAFHRVLCDTELMGLAGKARERASDFGIREHVWKFLELVGRL